MAITYGMSVKEFWDGNPDLFWAYRFSYFDKLKHEQEMFNNNAWLQGAYFHEAISVALCNAFGKRKVEYSKEPYNIYKDKVEDKTKASDALVAKIKGRVSQVQSILKNKESSTTERETIQESGEQNG